ncbi:Uncharacterised protein [Vibrio cholerae]|nr:Uncharacterised protein [Vibrio cholerae]
MASSTSARFLTRMLNSDTVFECHIKNRFPGLRF